MNETNDNNQEQSSIPSKLIGWLFFPISLFPLIALLTYDYKAIPYINTPPNPSTNWIGYIGDLFAYYGYNLLGLAIWLIPIYCIIIGCRLVGNGTLRPTMKSLWRTLLLIFLACLLQIIEEDAPGIKAIRDKVNTMNAGGVVGFIIATKTLVPLLNKIGASVLMLIMIIFSLIGSIGANSFMSIFSSIGKWLLDNDQNKPKPDTKTNINQNIAHPATDFNIDHINKIKAAVNQQNEEIKRKSRPDRLARTVDNLPLPNRREPATMPPIVTDVSQAPVIKPKPVKTPIKPKPAPVTQPQQIAADGQAPYILPPISLLSPLQSSTADHSDVSIMSQKLIDTLKLFGIDATLEYTVQGPVITKYAVMLAPGTRYSVVTNIADNLKGALHAKSLRIEAPIPGEECVGIEVPNRKPAGISFREIFESDAWQNNNYELPLLFGKDAAGNELIADLASMPHMLVAGATGQGKSVCLNSLISGLLMTRSPDQLKLIMIDPKSVEFTPYASIPHLLVPVITDNRKVVFSLNWAVAQMERRLKLFSRVKVKNLYEFNHRKIITQTDMFGQDAQMDEDVPKTLPYIVIIIDEAADLIGQCGKDVNPNIQRITQKARAAGIHIILATQRPEAKIITGAIKANIPGRVAFKTSSALDSRTILDESGAENLIGRGDMLYRGKDNNLTRAQGAWISNEEIENITNFISQHSTTQFDETFATKLSRVKEAAIEDPFAANDDDPDNQAPTPTPEERNSQREITIAANEAKDIKKAIECILENKRASISFFQRQMKWGYNHAATITEILVKRGILSEGSPKQVLVDEDTLKQLLNENISTDASSTPSENGADNLEYNDEITEEYQ